MKNNLYKLIALFFVLGMFTFSCDDVSLDEPQLDIETSQDNALALHAVGDVFGIINSGVGDLGKAAGDCPLIVLDLETKVMTITYPEIGCAGADGLIRSGIITATFDQGFQGTWGVNSSVTVTFSDYTVGGKTLTGTIIGSCTALAPHPVFTLESEGLLTLTFPDEDIVTWQFETTYTMLEGFDTKSNRTDDSWQIDELAEGTARNGNLFSREAIELITSNDCKYFVSGILKVTIGESDQYELEFSTPCGTVEITYKGISVSRTFE